MAERRILNSWKEIAGYLGRGVRTVQRWEVQLGLPVHRPAGKDHSAVLAFSSELDEWLNSRPVRQAMHPDVTLVPFSEHQVPEIQNFLMKADAMLQRLDALVRRNDELQRKLSEVLVNLSNERGRRELRGNGRSQRAEAGAA